MQLLEHFPRVAAATEDSELHTAQELQARQLEAPVVKKKSAPKLQLQAAPAAVQMPFEGGRAEPAEDQESLPCVGVEVQPSSPKGCSSRSTTPPGKSAYAVPPPLHQLDI